MQPSEKRKLTGAPLNFESGFSWEMDEKGNHRIVDENGNGGQWALYDGIAISLCGQYIAASSYYAGSIPNETVIKIKPLNNAI